MPGPVRTGVPAIAVYGDRLAGRLEALLAPGSGHERGWAQWPRVSGQHPGVVVADKAKHQQPAQVDRGNPQRPPHLVALDATVGHPTLWGSGTTPARRVQLLIGGMALGAHDRESAHWQPQRELQDRHAQWDHRADRPAWGQILDPAGAASLAGGAGAVVAELLAAPAGTVGSGVGAVVRVRAAGLRAHLLQPALSLGFSAQQPWLRSSAPRSAASAGGPRRGPRSPTARLTARQAQGCGCRRAARPRRARGRR
jgi:hypothetical protein